MTQMITVEPTAEEHVGIVHPLDGALAAEGSTWTRDTFTERLLQVQAIRVVETTPAAAPEAPAKPIKAGK